MREALRLDSGKEKGSISHETGIFMRGTLSMTSLMGKANLPTKITKSIPGGFKAIKSMVMENLYGLTVLNIRVTMSKTRRKAGDFLCGQIEDNMKDNGLEANSLARESLQLPMEDRNMEFGYKENDRGGFEKKNGRRSSRIIQRRTN